MSNNLQLSLLGSVVSVGVAVVDNLVRLCIADFEGLWVIVSQIVSHCLGNSNIRQLAV